MKSPGTLYRNILICFCLVPAVLPAEVFSQGLSGVKNLSLTIYSNSHALINEQRTLDEHKGIFTVQLDDISSQIDPSSIVIRFPGEVVKQSYRRQRTTMLDVLRSYIGHKIRFVNVTGQVRGGRLVALDGDHAIIHSPDYGGYIVISHIWDHVFVLDSLLARPGDTNAITWTLKGSQSGDQPFDLTYQTGGLNWHAHYNLILQNDHEADLEGWATIENQTNEDFKNADITLVAGNLHQANNPVPLMQGMSEVAGYAAKDAVQQRSFSDYHLYGLAGKQTIAALSKQMIPLVDGTDIGVKKEYVYNPGYFGPLDRANGNAVIVMYTVINAQKNHLGKPLPAGVVSIYRRDNDRLVLLGKDNIDHTAVDDSITVTQGEAFDLEGSDRVTDVRHISSKVTERDVAVDLSNHKNSNVSILVIQRLSDRDRIIKSNYTYTKQSAYVYEFKVPVKAHQTVHLVYSVQQTNP